MPPSAPLCATPLHIWSPCTAGPVIGDGHQRSRDAPANGGWAAKMAFRCDPSEPAAKGSRGRRCHGTPTDTDRMSEGSCHAGSVSDTAGGALTPCPAPKAGPAGSAGAVEGLGPEKRAPPSRSGKDRRMRRVPRGPIRGPWCQPGGKEAGPKRGSTRARADGRTLGGERSERARVRVQHEAGGEDGRPAGGRQAVCWPGSRTWRDEESGVLCAGPPAASKAVTGAESDRTPRPCRTAGGQRQQDGRRQRRDADGRYGSSR